ncbi:MAG: ABC transporter ATP-binding protein [Peptococcaceae bacterium]|nr:ABC transporter ATP-binding protein [Peptococcaceae bacterium]
MILETKDVVKRYNGLLALDNVSLRIPEGCIFGLIGPNGAGKTTLINAIISMTKIDSGEIMVFGQSLDTADREFKAKLGVVPQEIALYDDLSVYQNLDFFGRLYGLRGIKLKENIKEALEFVDLWERRNDSPKRFSGGMKRRLNIACALVHRPELVIMDEPTVGIDPQSRNHILASIRRLNENGTTIVYTSHYMDEVEQLCADIAILDHGRVIARGTKEQLADMVAVEEKLVMRLSGTSYTLLDCVKGVQGVKAAKLESNRLTVVSRIRINNINKIIDCVLDAGAIIEGINMERLTLGDVFLTLTGRSLRD